MTFIPNWEEFEKSAEMLYLRDPINTRYSLKYSHAKGVVLVKITDNKKVSLYTVRDFVWNTNQGYYNELALPTVCSKLCTKRHYI